MSVSPVGLIAEYNPLHRGHTEQLAAIRRRFPHAPLVVAMSGDFVQRGVPAVCSKYERAAAALQAGADLVLELPSLFVLRSAADFAAGAVRLLTAVGCTDLVFGAEDPDLALLHRLAAEPDPALLAQELAQGYGYGEARTRALTAACPAALALRLPNNLLGAAYLQAANRYAPALRLRPFPRPRYTPDGTPTVSGARVRKQLAAGHIPADDLSASEYLAWQRRLATGSYTDYARYELLALAALRRYTPDLPYGEMREGLEHRFAAANAAADLAEFWAAVKSKRYPHARLRRLTAQIVLGMTAADLHTAAANGPEWLRPLAMRRSASELLRNRPLPVLSRLGAAAKQLPPDTRRRLHYDILATDLAALCRHAPGKQRAGGTDYRHGIYVME